MLSKCSTGCYKAATCHRSVRRAVAKLRHAIEVFDELLQSCDTPSKCSTGCYKAATRHRSVRRAVTKLRHATEVFDEVMHICGGGIHYMNRRMHSSEVSSIASRHHRLRPLGCVMISLTELEVIIYCTAEISFELLERLTFIKD